MISVVVLVSAAVFLTGVVVVAGAGIKHEADDTLYLVDFNNNGRPRYLQDTSEGANSPEVLQHPGLILINNPLQQHEARADGIYLRPNDGKPLNRNNDKVSQSLVFVSFKLLSHVFLIYYNMIRLFFVWFLLALTSI